MFGKKATTLPEPGHELPGRDTRPWQLGNQVVLGTPVITDEVPDGLEVAVFGLGCFWGAEEIYWQLPGVWSTSVGYAGGSTPHPTYEEVCSGRTGHTEAVRIVFDPTVVSYADLVKQFFEVHDPTQGMRQGNDVGTQYRSAIYVTSPEQEATARELTDVYGAELKRRRLGDITTEIKPAPDTTSGSPPSRDRHGSRSLLTGKNTSCSPTATRTGWPFHLSRVVSGSAPGAPVVRQVRATRVIHSTRSSDGVRAGPDMYWSNRLVPEGLRRTSHGTVDRSISMDGRTSVRPAGARRARPSTLSGSADRATAAPREWPASTMRPSSCRRRTQSTRSDTQAA